MFVIIEVLQPALMIPGIFVLGMSWLRYFRLLVSLSVILTVLCATILAVYKLTRAGLQGATENVSRNNRKATWTVVILSVLFLVFNSILFADTWAIIANPGGVINEGRSESLMFYGLFLAIPFNSSINPIVYLTRRSDMRQFFKQEIQKFYCIS